MPLVKLLHYTILSQPGEKVRAWGYDFIVQKNGDATLEMPTIDAEREQAAGRVVIIAYDKAVAEKEVFTETPEDFFGCGSSPAFREQLRVMSKANLAAFAKKHLDLEFPPATGKDALVAQICLKAESLATKGE